MDAIIRTAAPADAEGLTDLLREAGYFTALEEEPRSDTLERLRIALTADLASRDHTVLVGVSGDGTVAGYLAVHWLPYLFLDGPEGFVSEVFLLPQARGAGLGRRLLEAAEQEGRSRGASRLHLVNMRDRDSYRRDFYTKAGFTERARAADFVRPLD